MSFDVFLCVLFFRQVCLYSISPFRLFWCSCQSPLSKRFMSTWLISYVPTELYVKWSLIVGIWTLLFFHFNNLNLYYFQLTQYPKPSEEEISLLRSKVVSVLSFYNEVLKNRKKHKNVVFFAVDEMFSRIEL